MATYFGSVIGLLLSVIGGPAAIRPTALILLVAFVGFGVVITFVAWRKWLRLPAGPFVLAFALIAAAPGMVLAAGYESTSGGRNASETISGVPVPGGGTRSSSTSSYDSFNRSRPIYDAWERANMTASTAVNVVGAMQSIAGLLGGMSAGPVVATPTGVYAPNGGGYGGGGYGYGYNNGGQVPPFVYQRAASAPPVPVCYPQGCYVWANGGWQWLPATQPAPTVTVQVGPAQPACGWAQRTDGRGYYWQDYVCR